MLDAEECFLLYSPVTSYFSEETARNEGKGVNSDSPNVLTEEHVKQYVTG